MTASKSDDDVNWGTLIAGILGIGVLGVISFLNSNTNNTNNSQNNNNHYLPPPPPMNGKPSNSKGCGCQHKL